MSVLSDRQPAQVTRAGHGGWLSGVCAGIASFRELPVALVRAVFVVAALAGGIGVAVYLACWLILPASDAAGGADGHPAGIVVLARVVAACIGLVVLIFGSALATVFGLGWIALVVAGLVAVLMYVPFARVSMAAGLLGIAALALPSMAVSAASISLTPQSGSLIEYPPNTTTLAHTTYRSGLGTMLIDLRHTPLPSHGQVDLHIRAGIRRTIVALPHDRCVGVVIHYHVRPFDADLATLLTSREVSPATGLTVFNRLFNPQNDLPVFAVDAHPATAPVIDIDFSSQGGSLQVRDYPDDVNPDTDPDWPGLAEPIDPRPMRDGATAKGYAKELVYWRHRVKQEKAWQAKLAPLIAGPCAS